MFITLSNYISGLIFRRKMNQQFLKNLNGEHISHLSHEGKLGLSKINILFDIQKTNNVRSLSFWFNQMTEEEVKLIANFLQSNDSLESLIISQNPVGDIGFIHLARALASNNSLESLDLSNNGASYLGAKYIAKLLRANKSIKNLNLSGNHTVPGGAEYISKALEVNKVLANLSLRKNNIGDLGADDISRALKINEHLKVLSLCNNQIGPRGVEYISEALLFNNSLTQLDLSHNPIGIKGFRSIATALKTNNSLIYLDLRGCRVENFNEFLISGRNEMIKALQFNHSIIFLDISITYLQFTVDIEDQKLAELIARNHERAKRIANNVVSELKEIAANPIDANFKLNKFSDDLCIDLFPRRRAVEFFLKTEHNLDIDLNKEIALMQNPQSMLMNKIFSSEILKQKLAQGLKAKLGNSHETDYLKTLYSQICQAPIYDELGKFCQKQLADFEKEHEININKLPGAQINSKTNKVTFPCGAIFSLEQCFKSNFFSFALLKDPSKISLKTLVGAMQTAHIDFFNQQEFLSNDEFCSKEMQKEAKNEFHPRNQKFADKLNEARKNQEHDILIQ